MRVESWMLIALLPALQFLFQRRVSLAALAITIVSPLFWFYICWKATGNALDYFETRNRYLAEYAAAKPVITTFESRRLLHDAEKLLVSTNLAVLCGCLAAAWITIRKMVAGRMWRQKVGTASPDFGGVTATNVVFFSNLGFLLLAYAAGSQPEIWSRYGLIFFTLGLPVTVWMFLAIPKGRPKTILATVILAVFAVTTMGQVREVVYCVSEESAKSVVASYLKEVHKNDPGLRIYCDDGQTRFLSGIPSDRFLTPSDLPADPAALLKRFDEAGVKYVVCTNWDASALTKLFPEVRQGKGDDVSIRLRTPAQGGPNLKFGFIGFDDNRKFGECGNIGSRSGVKYSVIIVKGASNEIYSCLRNSSAACRFVRSRYGPGAGYNFL
jgi:hypothetical protein